MLLFFGYGPDRDAAAVVRDGQKSVRRKLDLDPRRVTGDGLVHRVIDHLGEEVVHRLLVGAADVHAGAAADGLEAFEHFDVMLAVAAAFGRLPGARRFFTHFAVEFRKEISLRSAHVQPSIMSRREPRLRNPKRRDARQQSR